jgi:hypothetical protein
MGVRLADDRPGEALFRSRSGDRCRPLTLDEIAGLTEAFSDSDLPYKVDLADWRSNIDGRWRQTIMAERVALAKAAPTATRK